MTQMKPILFNTEMVRAILDGRKTVTRRIANISTEITCIADGTANHEFVPDNFGGSSFFRPRYWPGDILYVREAWGNYSYDDPECNAVYFMYRADFPNDAKGYWYEPEHIHFCDFPRWRPSIHMPKEAARIFLRVTDVRVERLQYIDAAGIRAEGLGTMAAFAGDMEIASAEFRNLWNSTIKPADIPAFGWEANPWVWVYMFERISKEETTP